jgi:hypothetical protein
LAAYSKTADKELGFGFPHQNEARSSLKARWSPDIFGQLRPFLGFRPQKMDSNTSPVTTPAIEISIRPP